MTKDRSVFHHTDTLLEQQKFNDWCEGSTGNSDVDAKMRALKDTGFMNHEDRKVVISFLREKFNVDWRCGAMWLEFSLVDFDSIGADYFEYNAEYANAYRN